MVPLPPVARGSCWHPTFRPDVLKEELPDPCGVSRGDSLGYFFVLASCRLHPGNPHCSLSPVLISHMTYRAVELLRSGNSAGVGYSRSMLRVVGLEEQYIALKMPVSVDS